MQNFSGSPRELILSFFRNIRLIRNLVYREVMGRYKGSMLGVVWSLVTPVFMLGVYTFVFSVIFKARWNAGSDSKVEFALVLFSGLIVFNLFAECISKAPALILSNVNYVKKVIFPLEILPWVVLGGAVFHFFIGLCVWLLAYFLIMGAVNWTALLIPFVIFPFMLFVMGISWILASLGVYLRDVNQLTGVVIQVLMFMSPIFFPASALPENIRNLLYLNPIATPIEMMRDVMYWNTVPKFEMWALIYFIGLCISFIGFAWFQKTRKGFADVL